MNSKIIFSFLIFLVSLVIFSGCKKHSEKFLGPQYAAAPANFNVLTDPGTGAKLIAYDKTKQGGLSFGSVMYRKSQVSPGNPAIGNPMKLNIGLAYQYYMATFSDKVSWTLTISSWKSHAVKEIKGLSNVLDESNCKWDGNSSNQYFFGNANTNDSAEVKLTFLGSDIVVVDTIRIVQLYDYNMQVINGVNHILIDDFEGLNKPWQISSFYPDLNDAGGGNTGTNAYYAMKLQGDFSYMMYGRDINNNTYIGSCNTPTLNDFDTSTFTVTDPNNMYINMYIYGFGNSNTTVSVIAYENDNKDLLTVYDRNANDKLIYHIPVTWTGWKLCSFRYSAFIKPNTGGGLGNNTLNPERLCGIALELDSYPTQGYEVKALVDMVCVTENGIFQK